MISNNVYVLVSAVTTSAQTEVDVAQLMSNWSTYMSQMQSTISSLSNTIYIVTGVVSLFGIVATAGGFLAQRRAQTEITLIKKEIKQFQDESKAEIKDFHSQTRSDIDERNKSDMELAEAKYQSISALIKQELETKLQKGLDRVEYMYSSEIIQKLQFIEETYASNLRLIEDILISFQNECVTQVPGLSEGFDFKRYNTFRHLLIRLVAGARPDIFAALSRILAEYAEQVGQTTAALLRRLVVTLSQAGRLSRTELRIAAQRLIDILDRRFPPPRDGSSGQPT